MKEKILNDAMYQEVLEKICKSKLHENKRQEIS
jgi:hypothetical protein